MLRWLLVIWGWLFGRKPKTEGRPSIPLNRAERRMVARSMRRRGAGWTRTYRKGRKQRHPFQGWME